MTIVPALQAFFGTASQDHRRWWGPVAVGIAYYLGAVLGVKASVMSEGIAIFWPPNAFLLAGFLLNPLRMWPAYALAAVPAEIAADLPTFQLHQALLFVAVNILEALIAAGLIKLTCRWPFRLDTLRQVAMFGLFALIVASGVAGLFGAAVYVTTSADMVSFWSEWRIWWFGDSLGLLTITPVLLGWLQVQSNLWDTPPADRPFEAALLLAATLLVGLWVFSLPDYLTTRYPASPILMLPLTIWAAARFGLRGAASLNLLIAMIAIAGTVAGRGHFVSMNQADNVLRLQEYLAALAFSSLALAALLQELQQQNVRLRALSRAVETVYAGIVITDPTSQDNPIIYVNKGFEAITGYRRRDAIGRNPRFLQDPGADAHKIQALRSAIEQRQRIRCTLRNRRKNGSLFYNRMTIDPVLDEAGRVSHFIGVLHDITDIVAGEQALRNAHRELELINLDLENRIEQRTRELKSANEQLAMLAATDPLTGAYNRRHFMTQANAELKQANRHGRALSLIALDIDHFKQINDHHGHGVGDRILIMLTETVMPILRPRDLFARFGGEEFCVLLPETGVKEAGAIAERLRAAIAELSFSSGNAAPIQFTISAGVAECQPHAFDIDTVLELADRAMYVAKQAGRNTVRIHSPLQAPPRPEPEPA